MKYIYSLRYSLPGDSEYSGFLIVRAVDIHEAQHLADRDRINLGEENFKPDYYSYAYDVVGQSEAFGVSEYPSEVLLHKPPTKTTDTMKENDKSAKTTDIQVFGQEQVYRILEKLMEKGCSFNVEPRPSGYYCITVAQENQEYLQKIVQTHMGPPKLFHFDIGDTDEGCIGIAGELIARSDDEAVARMKQILRDNVDEDGGITLHKGDGEYVRIYLNPERVAPSDIDEFRNLEEKQ